jgi:hypothetical protein
MDLLSAGDGGSRSWHSLLWHQWVTALRGEAAVLAHDPRAQPATSPKEKRTPIAGRPFPGEDECRARPGSLARSIGLRSDLASPAGAAGWPDVTIHLRVVLLHAR